MPTLRRTNRRLVKLTAVSAAALTCLALSTLLLLPADETTADPTRRGPARFLRLTEARIHERPTGTVLVVRGETNLVAGSQLGVAVVSRRQEILRLTTASNGRSFALEAHAAGTIVEGTYEVVATFRLNDQPEAVRVELTYQPATLTDRRALSLPLQLARAADTKAQVRELFDAVNQQPRDPAAIDALDQRARDLANQVWIGGHKTALAKLRLALEEARRPEPRRREFDKLVLEAHVLAGL